MLRAMTAEVFSPLGDLSAAAPPYGLAQSKTPSRSSDLTHSASHPVDVVSAPRWAPSIMGDGGNASYCLAQTITAVLPSQLAPVVPSICGVP